MRIADRGLWIGLVLPAAVPGGQRGAEHVLERAAEQDHEALDDHDHVPVHPRHVERELRPALHQRPEEDRRRHDSERVIAAHQGDDLSGGDIQIHAAKDAGTADVGFDGGELEQGSGQGEGGLGAVIGNQ